MSMFYFQMDGWQFLTIQGPDSKDFLYRITSTDFKKFNPPNFTLGTLLSANGKIILYFKIIILNETEYLFLIPQDISSQSPIDAFEKLHFRENLKITFASNACSYLRVLGSGGENLSKLKTMLQNLKETYFFDENKWCQNFWNEKPLFTFDLGILFPIEIQPMVKSILEKQGFKQNGNPESYRILAGDPAVPNEINSSIIPLEAQLNDAVHENKGCYPGQEVIERIRTQGQVPRRLILLRGNGTPLSIPQKITMQSPETKESIEVGTLTSSAMDPTSSSHWIGLGFIKKIYVKPNLNLFVNEQPVKARMK